MQHFTFFLTSIGSSVHKHLRLGANVHLQDNSGKRPLSFAAEQGSPKTIDMLIQAGARVEDIDDASVAKLEAIMSTVIH